MNDTLTRIDHDAQKSQAHAHRNVPGTATPPRATRLTDPLRGNANVRVLVRARLLHRADAAGLLDLLLGGLAVLLGRALLERLGDTLDELLGLLQAQAGDATHNLQHGDLLVRRERLEHQVELGLLVSRRTTSIATDGRAGGHHHHAAAAARRRVNVEGLLDRLDQLR